MVCKLNYAIIIFLIRKNTPSLMDSINFIFSILVLIFSVVVHEVAHGYAAYAQGDKTAQYEGRLTLNPIKHLEPFGSFIVPLISYLAGGFIIGWAKPVPFNPYNLRNKKWGEALVAVAGPASNIAIAIVFGLIIRFGTGDIFPESFFAIAGLIVYINIVLAIFNLMPVPPLDGSKILFAFLPLTSTTRNFLEKNGIVLTILALFFLWPLLRPVVDIAFTLITGR